MKASTAIADAPPSVSATATEYVSPGTPSETSETFANLYGERFARIRHVDQLAPFFMTLVSPDDHWLYLTSTGGLTAGRCSAETALFPYETVDKLYSAPAHTGPTTLMRFPGRNTSLWIPFQTGQAPSPVLERTLYKSVLGHRCVFEENNHEARLCFRNEWRTSRRYGFVRICELTNTGTQPVTIELLDGLRNLLPSGVDRKLQTEFSCLVDGYKTAEWIKPGRLAAYLLASGITDQAVPFESLHATVTWLDGLPGATCHLRDVRDDFLRKVLPPTEPRTRGLRCAFLAHAKITVEAGETVRWRMIADIGRSQAQVEALAHELSAPTRLASQLDADLERATTDLRRILGSADGFQCGGQEHVTVHHTANVLNNVMRGGIFADGYQITRTDVAAFFRAFNRSLAIRHAEWVNGLPETLDNIELRRRAAETGDRQLQRLALEFLPLTFSRRHGDPSRPWNRFAIRLRDEMDQPVKAYEGNWRDIFQNWEGLATSFPEFLPHFIAKFVNASTADGYNPYRITHRGIDWEEPDPECPWAAVGYWGDHQIIYLLRLLEMARDRLPGSLDESLTSDLYSYSDVPYRLVSYREMLSHPRETIDFDAAHSRALRQRTEDQGADGSLLPGEDGQPRLVNLCEKLLVPLLTKLASYVPGAGIWMNTQRPEWNDANNALVGYGVSVVTLAYLRRYLVFLSQLVEELPADGALLSTEVTAFLADLQQTLREEEDLLDEPTTSATERRRVMDRLNAAAERYRSSVYAGLSGMRTSLRRESLQSFLGLAIRWVDHGLDDNQRDDGLSHAYNLIDIDADSTSVHIRRLPEMLEGQVAALSSGRLEPEAAANLLRALRASRLYRADQHSYLLYPDRELQPYLERNRISDSLIESSPLLRYCLKHGETRIVAHDGGDTARFHPDLINEGALREAIAELSRGNGWQQTFASDEGRIYEVFEKVFDHRSFTGRSSSMFSYEGLGCIYWHMVAKLLVAVQENWRRAIDNGAPEEICTALAAAYDDIRSGLGFAKTPSEWGAFPTDPYSHTPGHAGAQQPGMTGQVKEEILTRSGELGWIVRDGCLHFEPGLLHTGEFLQKPESFRYVDASGNETSLRLQSGEFGATCCQIPIVYHLDGQSPWVAVSSPNGDNPVRRLGSQLTREETRAIFSRRETISRVDVGVGFWPRSTR